MDAFNEVHGIGIKDAEVRELVKQLSFAGGRKEGRNDSLFSQDFDFLYNGQPHGEVGKVSVDPQSKKNALFGE